jgi:hypothetical protein
MPANENPKSTHLPEVAGAIEDVTATLVVETGIRQVQSFTVSLAQDPTAAEAIAVGVLDEAKQKITLKVFAPDGVTPGVAAAKVGWTAIGK